ncbi:DHH family phosphoesterase [Rubeoparvulum massiliense]|uniref:DHH family phosphoesterase n=1 Tax=Rubeoparvulum massiliense TaxID=1631346 RepID=UPI00065E7185|nr:bifunctional oligoribonuclease/PAP phosphatase NrnA [Rubeoparvulum massiliense]
MSVVIQMDEAIAWLHAHDHYWVVAHERPDGDAISSTLAMGYLLQQLGKSYRMVNADPIPPKFLSLPTADQITTISNNHGEEITSPFPDRNENWLPKAMILVDCADERRAGPLIKELLAQIPSFSVDHHPTNNHFAHLNLVKSESAATAQLIYDLYEATAIPFDEISATLLYTGLLTDTGGFRHSNTTSAVMERAAHLLQYGVQPGDLANRFLETITVEHVALLQRALQSLELLHHGGIAVMSLMKSDFLETNATREDVNGIVNYGVNLDSTEVGVLFHEESNGIKVSFRSKDWLNVAELAQQFGGGGHVRAAGCTMTGSMTDVKKAVLQALEGQFHKKE